MNKMITINGRRIGIDYSPYVIAEMSANHNGDIDNAYKIIDMAKAAGADAIKMQTYTPDTLTIDCDLPDFQLTDGLWAGRSLYQLYQEAYTPWEWHKPLFDYAKK
jgi:N-acetylneuraminate synthase